MSKNTVITKADALKLLTAAAKDFVTSASTLAGAIIAAKNAGATGAECRKALIDGGVDTANLVRELEKVFGANAPGIRARAPGWNPRARNPSVRTTGLSFRIRVGRRRKADWIWKGFPVPRYHHPSIRALHYRPAP